MGGEGGGEGGSRKESSQAAGGATAPQETPHQTSEPPHLLEAPALSSELMTAALVSPDCTERYVARVQALMPDPDPDPDSNPGRGLAPNLESQRGTRAGSDAEADTTHVSH